MNADMRRLCEAVAEVQPMLASARYEAIVHAVLEELKNLPWQDTLVNRGDIDVSFDPDMTRAFVTEIANTVMR